MPAGATSDQKSRTKLPSRFWIFAAFALLYGIVETMNGNWATLYMSQSLGATAATASFALTAFWGMVTVGRVLFAAIAKRFPANRTYRLLPFVIVVAFVILASLPTGSVGLGILAFGLAGLGCSALLPLTISFGQAELTVIAASVAGGLIAFYQMGYGIAAFGVGPLEDYCRGEPERALWPGSGGRADPGGFVLRRHSSQCGCVQTLDRTGVTCKVTVQPSQS